MKRIYLGLNIAFFLIQIDAQHYVASMHDTNLKQLVLAQVKNNNDMRVDFLKMIQSMFAAKIFIGIGNNLDDIAAVASRIMTQVHTFEIESNVCRSAVNGFKNKQKIKVSSGDARKMLSGIIKDTRRIGRLIFWLDGNCSPDDSGDNNTVTPILPELMLIKKNGMKEAIILIDNLVSFRASDGLDRGVPNYPSVDQVQNALYEINPDYYIVVYGDVMIAFPRSTGIIISSFLEALTVSRLATQEVDDIELLLHFENIIASAGGADRVIIEKLANKPVGGPGLFYRFWRALMLMHEGSLQRAYDELKAVQAFGFPHWRIQWYLAQASYQLGKIDLAREHIGVLHQLAPTFDLAVEFSKKINAIKG